MHIFVQIRSKCGQGGKGVKKSVRGVSQQSASPDVVRKRASASLARRGRKKDRGNLRFPILSSYHLRPARKGRQLKFGEQLAALSTRHPDMTDDWKEREALKGAHDTTRLRPSPGEEGESDA